MAATLSAENAKTVKAGVSYLANLLIDVSVQHIKEEEKDAYTIGDIADITLLAMCNIVNLSVISFFETMPTNVKISTADRRRLTIDFIENLYTALLAQLRTTHKFVGRFEDLRTLDVVKIADSLTKKGGKNAAPADS